MQKQKSKQGRKALPLHQVKRNTNLFTEAGVIEQLGGLDATRAIAAAAIAAAVQLTVINQQ